MVRIGLFKRKKKEIRADTPAEMNVNTGQETSILTFFASTKKLTRSETLEIPTVAACISKLAGAVASLPVKLYRKEDGRITEITDDGRLKLLNGDTGDTLSTHDMWTAAIEDYFLGGGAWIYINSAGLKVRSLHYIDSRSVSILSNSDPVFKAFRVQINAREYYDFQFIKLLRKTHDGWTNIPLQEDNSAVLSAAYNAVRLENMMNSNGGCKPGFLKAQTRISKDVAEDIRRNYDLLYNNSSDRSERKLMVLNDGITFEPISSTAAELQLNENKKVNSMEICKLFGFPHTIIDGGASEDDNRKFISAVTALVDQIETELDRCLLLESEKEQGYYWAFDTKELTRGSIRERFDAYEIAARNNIMQIDEIRREEDLEPLGFNFVKLGLSDVLLNPQTMEAFTPNTGQTKNLLTGEERAENGDSNNDTSDYIQLPNGKMNGRRGGGSSGGSGGSSGGKAAGKVDKSEKDAIIKPEDVSATGENELRVKGFPSKQKLNNHWQNGRTHAEEYKPDGITTKEQYEKRGVELAESAADGKKILGYKTKEGFICRYDVKKNDYVKADINKGLRTLFKPEQGIDYYRMKEGEESAKNK